MTTVIAGLLLLDGAPVEPGTPEAMIALAARRWPHRCAARRAGSAGLGVAQSGSGAPGAGEPTVAVHPPTGCACVADARLDNRDELLARHGRVDATRPPSHPEAVLAAYLSRGERCAEELEGEFAFAVWDPRARSMLLGRDRLGERPLYLHHAPGRVLAFASDPLALFALPRVPYRVDEGRIADFLVDRALIGVDHTCTFYEGVVRLPPASTMRVSPEGAHERRYWRMEPRPTLRLPGDDAYAEALLDVLSRGVASRIRSAAPASVGSMLSGGLDSGAAAAVAGRLLTHAGTGPLATFSGVGPDPKSCAETRAALACAALPGFRAHRVSHSDMSDLLPTLEALAWASDEPFEGHQTLLRAMYAAAAAQGIRHVFNGGAGDVVLGVGTCVAHLLRRGRALAAIRTARELNDYYGGHLPVGPQLFEGVRAAVVPEPVRRLYHRLREGRTTAHAVRTTFIHPDFARRISLERRVRRYVHTRAPGDLLATEGANAVRYMASPDYTVGVEVYYRLAAEAGVEPWDPFQDLRVVEFATSLPGEQLLHGGFPKAILRRALAGLLPHEVLWRRGRGGVGWDFTKALIRHMGPRLPERLHGAAPLLAPYVRVAEARQAWSSELAALDEDVLGQIFELAVLGAWLERRQTRPVPPRGRDDDHRTDETEDARAQA